MKIEIWSDVMCPFCYIGKRRLETALAQWEGKGEIIIEWKSFQLNPNLVTDPNKNVDQYLADIKGCTLEQAKQLNARVVQMAADAGLTYRFDMAVVANSFDAHRLSHFAKEYGKHDILEELLFKAYFTEGKNTADHSVLTELAGAAGLDPVAAADLLSGNQFGDAVMRDVYEAERIGCRGVPFFVFDRKYAVSGAQPVEVFLEVLEQATVAP